MILEFLPEALAELQAAESPATGAQAGQWALTSGPI
jgi:hypothetical protein